MLDKLKAFSAYVLSFAKSEWSFEDYPVRIRKQNGVENSNFTYSAQIICWWTISGLGSSRETALLNLKNNFVSIQSSRKQMPRPGTNVPIEFAPTLQIQEIPKFLMSDFLEHILGFDSEDQKYVFISDESSLWDFTSDNDLNSCYNKILERYGIDVRKCDGAKIFEVLRTINEK
jgi:hypothetical protein